MNDEQTTNTELTENQLENVTGGNASQFIPILLSNADADISSVKASFEDKATGFIPALPRSLYSTEKN